MRTMRNCRDTGNEISITKLNKQMKRKRDGKKENYVALSHFFRDLEYLTFPVSLIHSSDTFFFSFHPPSRIECQVYRDFLKLQLKLNF